MNHYEQVVAEEPISIARRMFGKHRGDAYRLLKLAQLQRGDLTANEWAAVGLLRVAALEAAAARLGAPRSPVEMAQTPEWLEALAGYRKVVGDRGTSTGAEGMPPPSLEPGLSDDPRWGLWQAWHLMAYGWHGRRAYVVSDALAARMAATHTGGVTADDIRLPFPSVMLSFSPSEHIVGLTVNGPIYLSTIYLAEVEGVEGGRYLSGWCLGRDAKGKGEWMGLFFTLMLPPGAPLNSTLTDNAIQTWGTQEPSLVNSWRDALMWICNVLIYATNSGARREFLENKAARELTDRIAKLPPGGKRDNLKSRLKAMDPRRRIILGPDLPMPPEAWGIGAPLIRRVKVQGHWRNQPHGPKAQQRKLIWIEPFWRGPHDAPEARPKAHLLVAPPGEQSANNTQTPGLPVPPGDSRLPGTAGPGPDGGTGDGGGSSHSGGGDPGQVPR